MIVLTDKEHTKMGFVMSPDEYRAICNYIGNSSVNSRMENAKLLREESRLLSAMFKDIKENMEVIK